MLCSLCAYALEVPALTSRVMDTADIMQKGEIDELEEYLKKISLKRLKLVNSANKY